MNQNLVMVRGDDKTLTLTVRHGAEGTVYDLTDAAVTFTVDGLNISKTIGNGITVETPTSGVAVIEIDPADTAAAPDGRGEYNFDVQLVLADGSVKTPIRGKLIVLPDVTP